MNTYYYIKLKIDIPKFWLSIFKIMIPMLITLIIVDQIADFIFVVDYLKMIILGIIYSIVTFLLMWKLSMNSFEKSLILNLKNKLF